MRLPVIVLIALAGCPSTNAQMIKEPALPPAEVAKRVQATFEAWSTEDLSSPDCAIYLASCAERFIRKVGLSNDTAHDNPRDTIANPDGTWLPGWERAPVGTEHAASTFRALTFAASMRVHHRECTARHAALRAKLDTLDERLKKDAAALAAVKDPYAKLGGMVRLRADIKRESPDYIGTRHTMELLLARTFDETGRRKLYDFQQHLDDDAQLLRPRLTDDEELALECLKDVPAWQDPETVPHHLVKLPFPKGRREELERRVRDARDLERTIVLSDVTIPPFDTNRKPEELVSVGREVQDTKLTVKTITEDEKTNELIVTLAGRSTKERAKFDCKEVEKPSGVGPDGKLQFETVCKERNELRTVALTVRIADRPDVGIQVDDELSLWAYPVVSSTIEKKRPPAGTDPVVDIDTTGELKAFHVLEIWRRGIVVVEYFP